MRIDLAASRFILRSLIEPIKRLAADSRFVQIGLVAGLSAMGATHAIAAGQYATATYAVLAGAGIAGLIVKTGGLSLSQSPEQSSTYFSPLTTLAESQENHMRM